MAAFRSFAAALCRPFAAIGSVLPRSVAAALLAIVLVSLSACNSISYVQRNSPANPYKDYETENQRNASVLGMGEPISQRQMAANATFTLSGQYDTETVLQKLAGTYNVAVRWGNGVRRSRHKTVLMNNLTFDEARSYIEDVFDIQIIKEGERRLLVLPSASEPRLASFNPGPNVSLSQALRGLAEQCNYNLVITENKDKLSSARITTNLKDVTCYDAFEALLTPFGLSLINAGDYVTIGGLPQRQWTVNLYEPERDENISVNYSTDFSSGNSSSSGSSSSSSGSDGSSTAAGGSNSVKVHYQRNLWVDLEDDLNQLIKSNCTQHSEDVQTVGMPSSAQLLPPPTSSNSKDKDKSSTASNTNMFMPIPASTPNAQQSSSADNDSDSNRCGYVRINKSVGLVQMRAPRSVLEEASDIINRVQEIASRRLLLEARVLAVSRTRNFDQRARLRVGGEQGGAALSGSFIGSITSALSRDLATYTAPNLTTVGGISAEGPNLDAVIGLLEQYGTTYELMHPMMELMDRQRATLIDGRNEKYFIIQSTTTTGTATSTASDVQERNQFIGLQFSATAQISDNPSEPNTISLQIPITSLAKTVDIPGGVSGTTAGVAPVANTRLIDQKVRIRDGEIKVIGGLTKTVAVDTESGIPLLREVPALGKLANEQGISFEEVEFVVLLQVKRLN
ncbi:MAG: hypothetical protein GC129_01595 [Proteobacteria bacterium]|nr:hypothetical protein [Pseudomonadota bacterium]